MSYPNDTGEQVIKTIVLALLIAMTAVFLYDKITAPARQKDSNDLMTVERHEDNWDTESIVTDAVGSADVSYDSGFVCLENCDVIDTVAIQVIDFAEVNK